MHQVSVWRRRCLNLSLFGSIPFGIYAWNALDHLIDYNEIKLDLAAETMNRCIMRWKRFNYVSVHWRIDFR